MSYLYQILYLLPFDHTVWLYVSRNVLNLVCLHKFENWTAIDDLKYTCNTSTDTHSNVHTWLYIQKTRWEQWKTFLLRHFAFVLQSRFVLFPFFMLNSLSIYCPMLVKLWSVWHWKDPANGSQCQTTDCLILLKLYL